MTARNWLLEQHGPAVLARVADHAELAHREALLEPLASAWYPERALEQAFVGLRREIAPSDEAFRLAMERCSELGISTFFRVLLRVSTPRFVLRQVPAMWQQIRRGRGRVEVVTAESTTEIRYRDFPRFGDVNYRLLTHASLTACLRACTQTMPRICIADHGADWLVVVVDPG